jgi:hypothetical protein
MKFGGGAPVNLYGAISGSGFSYLKEFEGGLTYDKYEKILQVSPRLYIYTS